MSNQSEQEQEREQLKEEYKEHYRRIRDAKEKLRRTKPVRNISEAMQRMNSDELLDSVDRFLGKVRSQVANVEARLDVAMENLSYGDLEDKVSNIEQDETVRKEKAKETLKQVKIEKGLLYKELEKRAEMLQVEKTIGPGQHETESDDTEMNKEPKS